MSYLYNFVVLAERNMRPAFFFAKSKRKGMCYFFAKNSKKSYNFCFFSRKEN